MSRTVLDVVRDYEHICWYPGADADFNELLYLSDAYYKKHNVPREKGQILPDLYILTDVRVPEPFDYVRQEPLPKKSCDAYKLAGDDWEQVNYLYRNQNTRSKKWDADICIKVNSIERLADLELPLEEWLVEGCALDSYPKYYGRAFLMHLSVWTSKLGEARSWETDMLYLFAENAAFARDFLIANDVRTEYVVQVRTGTMLANEGWLCAILDRIGAKYFVANEWYAHIPEASSDPNRPNQMLNDLNGFIKGEPLENSRVRLASLGYRIEKRDWSNFDDVCWYGVGMSERRCDV